MKEIQLTRGKTALVSDDVFDIVSAHEWCATRCKKQWRVKGTVEGKQVLLYRFIMQHYGHDIDGLQVDHIDGNPLNNQMKNLRVATNGQNQQNRGIGVTNTSGFKGVSRCKNTHRWRVRICCQDKQYHGGYFDSKLDAHHAACALREKLHGEFVNHGKK